ncbi:hypothetical protein, partial [Streptomyces sp. JV190]|uniref:hypothetical protein n=1 Tax=Streptomyces sp. JV190 TaxID=3002533 RepID=UPI002E7A3AC3
MPVALRPPGARTASRCTPSGGSAHQAPSPIQRIQRRAGSHQVPPSPSVTLAAISTRPSTTQRTAPATFV